MGNGKFVDSKHQQLRTILRIIGPMVAGIGLIFTLVGFVDFFKSFNSFEPPQYFWCLFVGLPLMGIGMAISSFAYMGSVMGFQAKEVAPIAKDTFNYFTEETEGAIRNIAHAVTEGVDRATSGSKGTVRCSNCSEHNPSEAKFCKKCGASITGEKKCIKCEKLNVHDADYCNNCGNRLA